MTATSIRAGASLRRLVRLLTPAWPGAATLPGNAQTWPARLVRDDAAKRGRVIREAGVKAE